MFFQVVGKHKRAPLRRYFSDQIFTSLSFNFFERKRITVNCGPKINSRFLFFLMPIAIFFAICIVFLIAFAYAVEPYTASENHSGRPLGRRVK